MTILALDLATTTGFAALRADGRVESGEICFAGAANEGEGARFRKFWAWLRNTKERFPDLKRIDYERVVAVGENQAYAAQIHGGFRALLLMFADMNLLPCDGHNVTTVKMRFVGKGNAKKHQVIARCRELGFKPIGDNEADAIAVLHVATNRCPALPPRVKPSRKKREAALPEIPF